MITIQFAIGFMLGIQFMKWLFLFEEWREDHSDKTWFEYLEWRKAYIAKKNKEMEEWMKKRN